MVKSMSMKADSLVGVSVVVVNYNAGVLLAECVASILPQSDEIIVVDNASQDSSIEYCSRAHHEQSKLQIIKNTENLGFAAACNIGFQAASGETVLFLSFIEKFCCF